MHYLDKWKGDLLSLLAGGMLTLAFAPFDYSYLAIVSLICIYFSWLECSPKRAAFRGFLYGIGLFASGISWVYVSVHYYGGAPAIPSALLTFLIVCFWALFPAITGYLSAKISNYRNINPVWVIPFIWIFIEYFRGYWFLNGFPWLQIAYTQLGTPLQGYVPILGVYGTGFLLGLIASLIVASIRKQIQPIVGVVLVLIFGNVGAFLNTVQWTHRLGSDEIKVALVQGNVSQDKKWLPEYRRKTLVTYQHLTAQHWNADIVVWPETAIPAYLSDVERTLLKPLSDSARTTNTDLIVGIPATDHDHHNTFNTVLSLGRTEGRYNKNHLLPFGEYLPLQPLSGFVLKQMGIQLGDFTPGGSDQELLVAGGYPFSTSICYEDAFGDEIARTLPKAAFLVNLTNDAWFGNSIERHQHMQIAQMRSLETGRFMLRATNTGVTAIVAPDGSIVDKAPLFKTTVLTGKIFPMGGITPYARLGDKIILLVLLLGIVCVYFIFYPGGKAEITSEAK